MNNGHISPIGMLPFLLMLLSIALMPLIEESFWSKNKNKLLVSIGLSLPAVIFLYLAGRAGQLIETMMFDYLPFIILLGALFVITGGIHLAGDIEARPWINTAIIGIGALIASLMGTTGAAMLLIRPLLKANRERKLRAHTILFFIAIVANSGGLLSPLGDPPLFMMYLRGAGFSWFLSMFPEWLFVNGFLLLIYYLLERYYYKKENLVSKSSLKIPSIRVEGRLNFLWLIGVVLSVALVNKRSLPSLGAHGAGLVRDSLIVIMLSLSLVCTPKRVRDSNRFSFGPIEEVVYLFLGIFVTMVPCLIYLESHARGAGISTVFEFYFATGSLSSFLDNTPTAVTFYSLARGMKLSSSSMVAGIPEAMMKAICTASVFFGAMTYIGNGPNFMIKAIAEENGIQMPHFFKYMLRFSLILLLPVFVLAAILFF